MSNSKSHAFNPYTPYISPQIYLQPKCEEANHKLRSTSVSTYCFIFKWWFYLTL